MALSGSIKLTSGKAWEGKIYWSATQDVANNCSYVSMSVYTWKTDGYPTSGGGWFTGSAWIGPEEDPLDSAKINYEQEDKNYPEGDDRHNPIWRAELSDVTVYHNDDGTGSVEIGASITKGYSTNLANVTLSGSKTVTLDQIPRASSFAATDAAIGSVSTITIYRESKNIYHRIKAVFGSVSGYVTNKGEFSSSEDTITGTSVAFTIPTDFYKAIPKAKKGTCTLTLYALSGDEVIGNPVTTTIEITTVESRCNPTLTISLTHDNADTAELTGSDSAYIRGYSDAKCEVSATGRFGATIEKIWTSGNYTDNKDGTYTVSPVNSETITFYAQDSRGYTGQVSTDVTLVPYVVLTNSASAGRPNPTDGSAFIQFQGQYFNDSFGNVDNTLSLEYKIEYPDGSIDESWTTVVPDVSEDSYYAYISLSGFDYTKAYKVHTVVTDKLLNVERTIILKQGIPVFDWGRSDFQFHVDVKMDGHSIQDVGAPVNPTDVLRLCDVPNPYPVGSIYLSVNSTSPASIFGGSWEQIQDRFLIGAGNSYSIGTTGGSTTHTLTEDEMPRHNHKFQYSTNGGSSWYGATMGRDGSYSDTPYLGTKSSVAEFASYQVRIGKTGSGNAHNNMPPYLAVYMWKRVA